MNVRQKETECLYTDTKYLQKKHYIRVIYHPINSHNSTVQLTR